MNVRVGPILLVLIALSGVLAGCGRQPPAVDGTQVGSEFFVPNERSAAPPISGPALSDGSALAIAPGEITVINAWASWCAPCLTEMPILIRANRDYPNAQFVGLNVQDDDLSARQFVEDLGINFESIKDPEGSLLATIPGVPPRALPSTIVIDGEGRIAARIIGPVEEQQLTELLDRLTREG